MQHYIMAVRTATANLQESPAEVNVRPQHILLDRVAAGRSHQSARLYLHTAGDVAGHNCELLRVRGLRFVRAVGVVRPFEAWQTAPVYLGRFWELWEL